MDWKKHWWKILGVLLFVYAIVAGMLIPLKPGIESVEQLDSGSEHEMHLKVIGYNTRFTDSSPSEFRAFLKLDSAHYVESKMVNTVSDREAFIVFNMPASTPKGEKTAYLGLIIDNDADGFSFLPDGVYHAFSEADSSEGRWIAQPENLRIKSGISFPYRKIIEETIRNIYFHVNLWMSMFILFIASFIQSIQFLRTQKNIYDKRAFSLTLIGLVFGILGIATGAVWAKYTWGTFWTNDIKLNMAAVSMLIYLAYFILRQSITDLDRRARISAAYNVFALITVIPLIFVLPRMMDSLHPGSGGNPAFGGEDLDNSMRMVFYPSIIGLTLIGVWMANLVLRILKLEDRLH